MKGLALFAAGVVVGVILAGVDVALRLEELEQRDAAVSNGHTSGFLRVNAQGYV